MATTGSRPHDTTRLPRRQSPPSDAGRGSGGLNTAGVSSPDVTPDDRDEDDAHASTPDSPDRPDTEPSDRDPSPGDGTPLASGRPTPGADVVGDMTPPPPQPREFVRPGVIVGLSAWAVGLAVTVGLGVGLSAAGLLDVGGTGSALAVGAWLFSDGHLLPVALAGGPTDANVVADAGGALYVFAVVPLVALLLGSALAVGRVGVPGPVDGAKAGGALALGYAVAAVVGSVLTGGTVVVDGVTYALAPTPVEVFLVGVAYPLVVGAAGGAVAGR